MQHARAHVQPPLPDMYAQSLRAAGLRAECIHIRQSTSAHVTTNVTLSALLKSAQNLMSIFPSVYIVTDSDYDCGS